MSTVLIFAGANGSGKTTLAKMAVPSGMAFVNADEIRDTKKLTYIEAGKAAITKIDKLISKNVSFAFETTMSGQMLKKRFERLKGKKYQIVIFYLFAYPLNLLVERIKERVKKGGHWVKEEDVVRRYYRSVLNFWKIYRSYADEWAIINNNEFKYKNIAVGKNGTFDVIEEKEFEKFEEVLKHGK